MLRQDHGYIVAGGQKELADKIIRIGHLGFVDEEVIDGVTTALDQVLRGIRSWHTD